MDIHKFGGWGKQKEKTERCSTLPYQIYNLFEITFWALEHGDVHFMRDMEIEPTRLAKKIPVMHISR